MLQVSADKWVIECSGKSNVVILSWGTEVKVSYIDLEQEYLNIKPVEPNTSSQNGPQN